MRIVVQRRWETDTSICGEMYVDDQRECFTLEPSRTTPVHLGHPCIPAGTYSVILTPSPHLGYVTPELLSVPSRTAIRIHVANYPKDVLGCTAVGDTHTENFVGLSKEAFARLITLLKTTSDPITAEYRDPPSL